MIRLQARIDLWLDAPDHDTAEHQLRKLLNRYVAEGLGTVDGKCKIGVNLSHWKIRTLRFIGVLPRK